MIQKIRLRVWLLGIAPIGLVALVLALLFALGGRPRSTKPVASNAAAESVEAPAIPVPTLPVPAQPPMPPPAITVAASASAAPSASSAMVKPEALAFGTPEDPPEPLPEIDALLRPPPPDSGSWTPEEKSAYLKKQFDDVDARERTLERELAAARRSGDTATANRKMATLSYLRAKRDAIQRLVGHLSEREGGS